MQFQEKLAATVSGKAFIYGAVCKKLLVRSFFRNRSLIDNENPVGLLSLKACGSMKDVREDMSASSACWMEPQSDVHGKVARRE